MALFAGPEQAAQGDCQHVAFPSHRFKGIPVRPAAKPGMAGTYRMMISFPVIFDKHDTLVLFNLTLQLTVLRKFHILHIVSYGTYVEF